MAIIHPTKYCCTVCHIHKSIYTHIISLYIAIYNNYTYSAGMKERCRDGCRTSLLIAGVFLVPAIFHTLLPPCHPYITIHFMEMIFSTCNNTGQWTLWPLNIHYKKYMIAASTSIVLMFINLKSYFSFDFSFLFFNFFIIPFLFCGLFKYKIWNHFSKLHDSIFILQF